ncbi:hypothetical protein RchiOBHm_Chr1g0383051 [Rosa chinensis]|uniref:Uncharacterized protein n=1 Tax=Rosa chinensis TaxID=74649 RepID=A0A2P6SPI7_ROSCH|nr:hypothetical protein RchiOBHm_Chr1g0383051 [Rosa chinensis]
MITVAIAAELLEVYTAAVARMTERLLPAQTRNVPFYGLTSLRLLPSPSPVNHDDDDSASSSSSSFYLYF